MRVRPPNMEPVWDGKPIKPEDIPERKNVPVPDEAVNERLRKGEVFVYNRKPPKKEE